MTPTLLNFFVKHEIEGKGEEQRGRNTQLWLKEKAVFRIRQTSKYLQFYCFCGKRQILSKKFLKSRVNFYVLNREHCDQIGLFLEGIGLNCFAKNFWAPLKNNALSKMCCGNVLGNIWKKGLIFIPSSGHTDRKTPAKKSKGNEFLSFSLSHCRNHSQSELLTIELKCFKFQFLKLENVFILGKLLFGVVCENLMVKCNLKTA